MSYDLNVFLADPSAAAAERWSRALAARGWQLQWQPGIALGQHSGYLRATAQGQPESGFELFIAEFDPAEFAADAAEDGEVVDADVLAAMQAARFVAMFSTPVGRSETDLQLQRLAAALLAEVTKGVLGDPQSGALSVPPNLPDV